MTCACGCGRTLRADNRSGYARSCRHLSPAYREYMTRQWASRKKRARRNQNAYVWYDRWLADDDPPEVIERKIEEELAKIRRARQTGQAA